MCVSGCASVCVGLQMSGEQGRKTQRERADQRRLGRPLASQTGQTRKLKSKICVQRKGDNVTAHGRENMKGWELLARRKQRKVDRNETCDDPNAIDMRKAKRDTTPQYVSLSLSRQLGKNPPEQKCLATRRQEFSIEPDKCNYTVHIAYVPNSRYMTP
ncbi:uncharacterized protein PV06_05334 [Exophiala oligosperma]|uniref:Uncharacterized protein n=1 Tax=Exophiala oligosperma TaxID=215243 RepID=A0A0D2DN20_9EURO|nr:uncharacterized protein PV06_05334 [Exophiala oligosperma]KIW44318.1 hypothetical protein PV06_05334 [Exophiala oligosperma]